MLAGIYFQQDFLVQYFEGLDPELVPGAHHNTLGFPGSFVKHFGCTETSLSRGACLAVDQSLVASLCLCNFLILEHSFLVAGKNFDFDSIFSFSFCYLLVFVAKN